MARNQAARQMAVETPLGEDVLLLRRMVAREQLGRLFRFELDLLSDDMDINLPDLVGQNATVRLERDDEETRYYNGYISQFVHTGFEGRSACYRMVLRPWLWFLTRTSDCRIWQNKTVPDLIKEVFRLHGLTEFEDALNGSYREWVYCVQYRETDFNFVSRLMEQEGIYYYFKHENGRHTLVLSDGYSSHDATSGYEEVPFYEPGGVAPRERDHLFSWRVGHELQPCNYALADFDFESPLEPVRVRNTQSRDHAHTDFEIYDYPGQYVVYGDGEHYAQVRAEELQAQYEVAHGRGTARGLHAGGLFSLAKYPRAAENREYLIVSTTEDLISDEYVSADGDGEGVTYNIHLAAIDARQQYRSRRTTPKPLIQGPQTATVVGASDEEIWTDEYGRVKVHFHWDRHGEANENSSCWVRVSQAWAGKNWGVIYIPRIGQEVIVEFLEGDADRPIITGRVYNGAHRPPYDLPDHATMSTVKSYSSKGGEGFNEIRFEDAKDEEQIFVHAQKNYDQRVLNDRFEWTGNNRHLIVINDKFEHVQNNRHEKVDTDHYEEIGTDRHLKVGGKEAKLIVDSKSLKVTGDVIETFESNHSEEVTGDLYLKAANIVIEATDGITLKVGGNSVVIDSSGTTINGGTIVADGDEVKLNSGAGSSAADGSAGSLVEPSAPEEAEEADEADPGQMEEIRAEQIEKQEGKYGSVQVKPFKRPQPGTGGAGGGGGGGGAAAAAGGGGEETTEEEELVWIEIELVDEDGNPVPGERYEIKLPDGETVASGTLDNEGFARVDGIEPGTCQICFPELDEEAWERDG